MKRVTICIPTYNSERTLGATLQSILGQTYREIFVKVFDNGSTDRTVQIARNFALTDSRVQIFAHEENIGAEGNFNRCLAAADGDYTAIFHADDLYDIAMVETQVAFLEDHPTCSAVATGALIVDGNGRERGERFLPPEFDHSSRAEFRFEDLLKLVLKYGNFITCPSVMARTSAYREIGIWNGKEFRSSADLDVWLRLSKVGRFGLLTAPLMRYRVSTDSFTVREVKGRISEHDLLHVLRTYVSNPQDGLKLSASEVRYLEFQEFKDIAARRANILLSRKSDVAFPEFKGSIKTVLPIAFQSFYHFKFISIASVILFSTWLMKLLRIHR